MHIALSAFIATTGIAITALSWYGVRRRWALNAAVSIVVVGLAIALPAHYPWGLATPWHLGPVYAAVVLFLAGAVVAYSGMRSGEAAASQRT